jgi:hypothetical protein
MSFNFVIKGFDRTYSKLPVLVVKNYTDLTPALLEQAYPCFLKHAQYWRFEMLRHDYWLRMLR